MQNSEIFFDYGWTLGKEKKSGQKYPYWHNFMLLFDPSLSEIFAMFFEECLIKY